MSLADEALAALDEIDLDSVLSAELNLDIDIDPEEILKREHPELYEEMKAEESANNLKRLVAENKRKAAQSKKADEDAQMAKYIEEERAAESAEAAMKERIARRKKELAAKKQAEEGDSMSKYVEEERAAEEAARAMKERIAAQKKGPCR